MSVEAGQHLKQIAALAGKKRLANTRIKNQDGAAAGLCLKPHAADGSYDHRWIKRNLKFNRIQVWHSEAGPSRIVSKAERYRCTGADIRNG